MKLIDSPIAWVEGMLVMPQHFEQQEQVLHRNLVQSLNYLTPQVWGFAGLEVDREWLSYGKIRLRRCEGRFPEGTLFDLEEADLTAMTLEVKEVVANEQVYLGLPLDERVTEEADRTQRYRLEELPVKEATGEEDIPVLVKQLRLSLLRESERREAFLCLPLLKIKTADPEKGIVLEETFVPPMLNVKGHPQLARDLEETSLWVERKQKQLSDSLRVPLQSRTIASTTDLNVLQILNRYSALLAQYQAEAWVSPARLYGALVQLTAELDTFYQTDRLAVFLPRYDQARPGEAFAAVKRHLMNLLQTQFQHQATYAELTQQEDGSYRSGLLDPDLLRSRKVILCVRSDSEKVQRFVENQLKIASPEELRTVVQLQLSGVSLERLTLVPPQLPFYPDAVYLRLEKQGDRWQRLLADQQVAAYFSEDLVESEMSLWLVPDGLEGRAV